VAGNQLADTRFSFLQNITRPNTVKHTTP
jgi:hypothetical protein